MRPIRTERLTIRNWQERDRPLFHLINSDDRVMEFFPFRRSRAESDIVMDRLNQAIERDGFGFAALELNETGECIGFAGLSPVPFGPPPAPGSVEIGWRLATPSWGKGYVTEAAQALLAFGFDDRRFVEIVSFAVWNNRRSTAVMERLGMARDPAGDFDHPYVPDTHPQMKRHVFYRLTRERWLETVTTWKGRG